MKEARGNPEGIINDFPLNATKEAHDIPVGRDPVDIAVGPPATKHPEYPKIYVANSGSNTVSVINSSSDKWISDIHVGAGPVKIAYDRVTNMIYVANVVRIISNLPTTTPGTVSVIDGSSDKVAVGVIFNVNPANSGKIICNNVGYLTNTYGYVDVGTNCIAQHNENFDFNNWVESPLTNRNSSTPVEQPSNQPENIMVNRYGIFTANFKPHPQTQITIPPDFLYGVVLGPTVGAILGGILGWYIPYIMNKRTTSKDINKPKGKEGKDRGS